MSKNTDFVIANPSLVILSPSSNIGGRRISLRTGSVKPKLRVIAKQTKEVRDCHVRSSGLAMTSAFICVQIIIFFIFFSFASAEEIKPICDREYFPAVHTLLKKAKESVYLIMHQIRYYETHPQSSANIFCDELIAAAKRGVKVKAIIEQSDLEMFLDSSEKNRDVGYRLVKGGVSVYFDPSKTTTHCKLLVVDQRYTVIGSTNWSYYALDKNYESSVLIDSIDTANYFIEYFEKLRKKCPMKLEPPKK